MKAKKRSNELQELQSGLKSLSEGEVSRSEALRLLQLAAILKRDGQLPLAMNYQRIEGLLRAVFGESLESDQHQVVNVCEATTKEAVRVARGVDLALTKDNNLAAISIDPPRFREGKRAMSFVGIVHDKVTDLSVRHDDYLVEAYSDWQAADER